jgi:monoamine oxidase
MRLDSKAFLRWGGLAAAAFVLSRPAFSAPPVPVPAPAPVTYVPVLILGAGISGLTTQDELERGGVHPQVYEAANRIGGRIWSIVDPDTGITTNLGGELVDSTHTEMLELAKRAGVPLITRNTGQFEREGEFEYHEKTLTWRQVEQRIFSEEGNAIRQIAADQAKLRDETVKGLKAPGTKFTPFDVALDQLSIDQYLKKIGAGEFLRALLDSGPSSEVGKKITELSARVLFNQIRVDTTQKKIQWLPKNDQKYILQGGSQKITFNHLRDVDIRIKGLPPETAQTIHQNSYGAHTKLLMYFDERTWWEKYKHSGDVLTDKGFQIWDSSNGQPGKNGLLTAYFGESITTPEQVETKKKLALETMERIFPGISQHFVKVVAKDWPYSYVGAFSPGDYTRERGFSFGNMEGAGEATDPEQFGYMEGAVRSGQRAAKKIIEKLRGAFFGCFRDSIAQEAIR